MKGALGIIPDPGLSLAPSNISIRIHVESSHRSLSFEILVERSSRAGIDPR